MRHHRLKVGPLARHSGTFHGPNHVSTGSNGLKTLVRVSQMVKDQFEKRLFDPLLAPIWSQNGPLARRFGTFHGPNRVTTGPKWAKNTCLSMPNGLGALLEQHICDPLVTPFWSQLV